MKHLTIKADPILDILHIPNSLQATEYAHHHFKSTIIPLSQICNESSQNKKSTLR